MSRNLERVSERLNDLSTRMSAMELSRKFDSNKPIPATPLMRRLTPGPERLATPAPPAVYAQPSSSEPSSSNQNASDPSSSSNLRTSVRLTERGEPDRAAVARPDAAEDLVIPLPRPDRRLDNDDVADYLRRLNNAKLSDYERKGDRERVSLLAAWTRTADGMNLSPVALATALEALLPSVDLCFYVDYARSLEESPNGYLIVSRLATQLSLETQAPLDRLGILYRQNLDESLDSYVKRAFAEPDSPANVDAEHRRDVFTRIASGILTPNVSVALVDRLKDDFNKTIHGRDPMCVSPPQRDLGCDHPISASPGVIHLTHPQTSSSTRITTRAYRC